MQGQGHCEGQNKVEGVGDGSVKVMVRNRVWMKVRVR